MTCMLSKSSRNLRFILQQRFYKALPSSRTPALAEPLLKIDPYEYYGITITTLNEDTPPGKLDQIVAFMSDNFLRSAPIPRALGLDKSRATSPLVKCFVENEMRYSFTSGPSVIFEKQGRVVGAAANILLPREDSYHVVENASMLDWFTAAAEIAMESDAEHPELVWRRYQWQYTYNKLQEEMQRRNSPFAFFIGMLFLSSDARGNNDLTKLFANPHQEFVRQSGGLVAAMCTHSHAEKVADLLIPGSIVVDSTTYKDQVLRIGGRRVFQPMERYGRISMMVGQG